MELSEEDILDVLMVVQTLIVRGHRIWKGKPVPLDPSGRIFDAQAGRETLNHVWENRKTISRILKDPYDLTPGQQRMLRRWQKQAVFGWFVCLEIEGEDMIVMGPEGEATFWRVHCLGSTWEEMTAGRPLPVLFQGALLPWKDSIVGEGFLVFRELRPEIPLCDGMLQEIYQDLRHAKENGTVRTGFSPPKKPDMSRRPGKSRKKKTEIIRSGNHSATGKKWRNAA